MDRLMVLARKRLGNLPRGAEDEEDIAISAIASFCRGVKRGRFPQLSDPDDLWRLLVVITARKAAMLRRREGRQKRGGMTRASCDEPKVDLSQVLGQEPTPEFAAQVSEEYQRLLACLGDSELETVALRKLEGHTSDEIATQLGRSLRTIERKLSLIRRIWEREVTPYSGPRKLDH
jgi:DNA-directed RNA polymerase specialized sigma24 family protein